MDEIENRPKRQKRETSYKSKAFEKFKQLCNKEAKYEVGEIENVYELVDEKEYTEKVLSKQDWIVDDNGSGYVEYGSDEFEDNSDPETVSNTKNKGKKRKKRNISENAGKGSLHQFISNMPAKKKETKNLENDNALSDLLDEIDEKSETVKIAPLQGSFTFSSRKQAAKDYMKSFSSSLKSTPLIETQKKIVINKEQTVIEECSSKQAKEVTVETEETAVETKEIETHTEIEDSFRDMEDFDMTEILNAESQIDEMQNHEEIFMNDWNQSDDTADSAETETFEDSADQKILRFYWWDCYEDSKHPGTVFLFGKIYSEEQKNYISCCVAVRNIERKLFFLPRTTFKDSEKEVSFQDVYKEINEDLMKRIKVKQFKAKPTKKKYVFNPEIPVESDYIEVRYSATDQGLPNTTTGKTFSKVFGTETSYIEIFLLERKMKGPCWLDIKNAVQVQNPITWCSVEYNCNKPGDVQITISEKLMRPPPLIVASINMRCIVNSQKLQNEIIMLSCIVQKKYAIDKEPPIPPFQQHFCVFTSPSQQLLPYNLHEELQNYKATTVQKMDSEKALLNYFINQFTKIDPDLIVGHDLYGYQSNVLAERLTHHNIYNFSKLSRLKRRELKPKLERELFVGRLVCDIKISTKELIKSRSYDLDTLCQTVLKLKDNERIDLEPDDIQKMYQNAKDILRLISLTMQDTSYILKIMYNLNMIPLALQITNIAGNIMSRTLLGGRSERNEYLLLHAFYEKDYIVPDKEKYKKKPQESGSKKPTYSGGLVLEPKVGFYDKLVLLMDFNSLYPSIIQEYNICFSTLSSDEDNVVLPEKNLPTGILPTEIRKLVESRREVKKLMNSNDLRPDLRMQYNIRQMALKLTANSMYGCLGFYNSRFYAKNLASLITQKGREILTNTKDLVERMQFEVIYGDTDSLMINTNILEYDEVFKIGNKIKQEVNRYYKQIELDIDGVFKSLLLLKKKKYAAKVLSKDSLGKLYTQIENKGLDIVRRDWSQLACTAGQFIIDQIFTEQTADDRIEHIRLYLEKLHDDLAANRMPLQLLVITKQLTKNLNAYNDKKGQPHVQVALRYNKQFGGHYRAGDTVPYVICNDGTTNSYTERAYHIEELKNQSELHPDVQYYLSQQVHAVISRICEPLEGLDAYQLANWLSIDTTNLRRVKNDDANIIGENVTKPEYKYRSAEKFQFKCMACNALNVVEGPLEGMCSFLEKCTNQSCTNRPIDNIFQISNQLLDSVNSYVNKYYYYEMMCEDPMCTNETRRVPMNFAERFPVCSLCQNGVLVKKYTEYDLYIQLSYFHYIFDLSKVSKKPIMEAAIENGYELLKQIVEKIFYNDGYLTIDLKKMFESLLGSTDLFIDEEVNEFEEA